jgi:hypothetical protein
MQGDVALRVGRTKEEDRFRKEMKSGEESRIVSSVCVGE